MHDLEWLLCYGEMMMNQRILEYHFIYSVDSREHHGRKPWFFNMEYWAIKDIFPYSNQFLDSYYSRPKIDRLLGSTWTPGFMKVHIFCSNLGHIFFHIPGYQT